MNKNLKEKYEKLIISTLHGDTLQKLFKNKLAVYNTMKKIKYSNKYEPKFNFNYTFDTLEVLYNIDKILDEDIINKLINDLVYIIIYNSYYRKLKEGLLALPDDKINLKLNLYGDNFISFYAISSTKVVHKINVKDKNIDIFLEENKTIPYDTKTKEYMNFLYSKFETIKSTIDDIIRERYKNNTKSKTKYSYKNSVKFNENDMETLDVLISLFEYDFDICHYPISKITSFINILIDKNILEMTDKNKGTKLTLRYKGEYIIDVYETLIASKSDLYSLVSYKKICSITMEDILTKSLK